jgi:DNA-binding transcriptional LysR family regulator
MDVNDILIFVRVAQAGSFSKAAKLLKMPISTVSRRVADLETQLGIPLLIRTTRSLKITDVGKAYLEHGNAIAAEIEKAESIATNLQSIPQGTLKITATTDFGNQFLGKMVSEFLKANPRVQVDVVLTERVVDLIQEGFDLAIRIGDLDDSTLMARKLGSIDLQLYASPEYLRAHGEPKHPADLAHFQCIRFTGEEESSDWHLTSSKGETTVHVSGRTWSNNMSLVREFAISGEGLALMPHFLCADDLKSGRLCIILEDWVHSSGPIHVVYPGQRFVLPRVKAFVEHLVQCCKQVQWRHPAE